MTQVLQDNLDSSNKRLWEDPALMVERSLIARAQQFGPNSGGANGPSFDSMISPFVQSTASPPCTV